ncbi:MAG: hypothetical protein ACI89R_000483 [Candidatus Azotimanducaceae bacterium]|jgi:hypothetical protein
MQKKPRTILKKNDLLLNSMAKKKAFALRINEDMLKAVERWAADEFRSTNGQLEWMLNKCLKDTKREPKKKEDK